MPRPYRSTLKMTSKSDRILSERINSVCLFRTDIPGPSPRRMRALFVKPDCEKS